MLLATQIKSKKCLRCSRPLSNPISMYVGFGPICSETLGIQRPDYDGLMRLNPENEDDLVKLQEARQQLEAANKVEGTVALEGDQVIIKFPWGCQDFDAIKATVKKFAAKWNPQKKQWEASARLLPELLEKLKVFPTLIIPEDLFQVIPPEEEVKLTKLETLAAQMKKHLETVDITNITLKNGLQLFLKRENGTYKVFCARKNVLPSKVEVVVIGNSFFGKGQWEFGKAKTSPPLPKEGYVIQPRREGGNQDVVNNPGVIN